ncbi:MULTISPECIES: cell division protein FtsQ/DivIB [Shewanella]|uniref:Cell division protein FtsQ n=2 Tax=Shewanella putrefaciens TaxID=24 RepID=A4Y2N8_SHEPC|nr:MULTISPECIES: cell division protein FtsQ/DivIB [Shewanella]CAD6367599.1 Cell division protein FtsQ [Shewanella hafniensis]ABM23243.1 Polypeptide-transport-associated domain protein, FtsQ-type [Shewanella sp. W3-18-1]AVV84127.1 cell division protein FtsQ [Shewanella putrefaciens]MCK7631174.1 cell division protein FtsQ/DivIB [Shewanella sp. JNE9-1]MCK7635629.1 cell division protein FtsQ/DivIB [Shewanella sp. JNE17]
MSRVNWYLWSGIGFLSLVIGSFVFAGYQLHKFLNDASTLPIEAVAIKGERTYTTDRDIQIALQDLMQRSFFSADISLVQQALEALPWVYRASVRREWPAKLRVYLQEQQPVAHWNGASWLNVHGEVFEAPARPELEYLPQLSGPDDMGVEVLTAYAQVNSLLKINGFTLASLNLTPRHAWHATLENGIVLDLGREDKIARIQRFITVYPLLAKQDKPIARVDLRYDTGLAVGWGDAQTRELIINDQKPR